MKTTIVPMGDGSAVEVRHDLKPGQTMFVGWVEQLGVELVQAPMEVVSGRGARYRVKRGRGGRRKRRCR